MPLTAGKCKTKPVELLYSVCHLKILMGCHDVRNNVYFLNIIINIVTRMIFVFRFYVLDMRCHSFPQKKLILSRSDAI